MTDLISVSPNNGVVSLKKVAVQRNLVKKYSNENRYRYIDRIKFFLDEGAGD